MRVQTEEWQKFIPGVRMYKGKLTLFYNGEKLWDRVYGFPGLYHVEEYDDDHELIVGPNPLVYNKEQRNSWEVIIVLPGVEVIPKGTFKYCRNVETIIMSDTVRRIEDIAISHCNRLTFIRLSQNLEYIGESVFFKCELLVSIFIPPLCREIRSNAFQYCWKLIILSVPQHTFIANADAVRATALIEASPFDADYWGVYASRAVVEEWIKNINAEEQFELHRLCSSYFHPSEDYIYKLIKERNCSLRSLTQLKNSIGVTPFEYLSANPFADIDQRKIVRRFVLDMMGETNKKVILLSK
ncbi:hypothetical protein CTEN210_04335 [Chaetoceros tenuissimus]|uniref:Leucine-rich repeat domain-containing protein n=1 Tax=Chaetoceros tenuissimus TaxID=426638 RepID=A0AAD3CLF9_9STRA|nr:hypothetical protein CTEN210_04335 [Chaetoceros tenuissimus]